MEEEWRSFIREVAVKSKAGRDEYGSTKTNQDDYLKLEKIFGIDFYIFGVFDGHGKNILYIGLNGNLVSKKIVNYFTTYYKNESTYKLKTINEIEIYNKLKENEYEIIRTSFKDVENNISKKVDINMSGSTCVLVFILGEKIICANAGDSRAIMGRKISKIHLIKTQ